MNWTVILQSALVSASVTLLGGIYLKRIDFNYNYRSYILDKRKQAYEKAEGVINELLIKIKYTHKHAESENPDEFEAELDIFKSRLKLGRFVDKITDLMNYNFWFSKELMALITELQYTISFHYVEFDNVESVRVSSGLPIGTIKEDSINALYARLSAQYIKDIKHLKSLQFLKK